MKKWMMSLSILCVIFLIFFMTNENIVAFALSTDFPNESIEFVYKDRVFIYELKQNIKSSSIFEINYEINKYDRFSSLDERKQLLNHMLELNFSEEVAINYLFPNINKKIEEIDKNISKKPKNASLDTNTNTNKVFYIKKEIIGEKLDKNKLYHLIADAYLWGEKLSFQVPIIYLDPEVKSEDFAKFTNLRADFSTDISRSSADRKHNIKNALKSLNLVEIAPNGVFSFNKIVGRRTAENGYRTAKIIVNNEFVDGLGGGVCQVSTTLYNTALLAGLEILEANKHSKQVSYIKYGFDAMVNYASSDLKFKNNTNEKIIIVTNYTNSRARIRIFGEDLNGVSYKLSNEIVSITEPIIEVKYDDLGNYSDKVEYEDEYFYLKNAYRGMEIKSYRDKYVKGKLENHEFLRHDKFKVQNGVKVYGTKKRADENCTQEGVIDELLKAFGS